jgi:hypothetical protein
MPQSPTSRSHSPSPDKEVYAALVRLFEQVGLPISPYGPDVMTIEDCFDLIAGMYGRKAAARCLIEVTYH